MFTMRPPSPLPDHRPCDVTGHQKGTTPVELVHPVPHGGRAFQPELPILKTGIVHQEPRGTVAGNHFGTAAHDRVFVREVDMHGPGGVARFSQSRSLSCGPCIINIGNDDRSIGLGQNGRNASADAARTAGHQGYFICQAERGGWWNTHGD